ncbi:MAG: cytochrome c biogenesis protein CcdA [Candidatus Zixiibacteriota bacterium]
MYGPMRSARFLCLFAILAATQVLCMPGLAVAGLPTNLFGEEGGRSAILTVEPLASADTVAPGDTLWLAARLELAPEWHVNSAQPLQDYLIPTRLELETPASWTTGRIVYPPGETVLLLGDSMSVYESGTVVFASVVAGSDAPSGPIELTGTLHYQGCDDKSCVAPDDAELSWKITIASQRGSDRHADLFASIVASQAPSVSTWSLKPKSGAGAPHSDLERLIAEHGAWGYVLTFLLAFGTGLLLSFSPCTYPMIPITVSIFAGQARGAGRGFVLSLVYVLTMAVLYGIMGTVVASVGGVFGAWLAHPVVVGAIVAIFVVFALSMFGLYELQIPERFRNRMAGRGGEGIGGAIVLGAVAALVVSPCVGPFVAGIMLYVATAGSALLGFSVLFTFALGLGTLFVLIGTFSSAIQSLPRAGEWMESVKKFFGFVLLLMALYFLRTLIPTSLTALLAGLLFLAAAVFGGGLDRLTAESRFFARLKKAFGILCLVLAIYLLGGYLISSGLVWPSVQLSGLGAGAAPSHDKIPWLTDLDAALGQAQQEGRPVLIDTWATWCANCYKLDEVTWSDDGVATEATRFVPVKLQLETSSAPQTREFLDRFAIRQYSLPTIILIDSHGEVADVIFGFVNAESMRAKMRAVS